MSMPGRFITGLRLTIAAFSLVLASTGCGGSNFASELATRPKARTLGDSPAPILRLPQDEPFSIHFSPSHQAPGLGGSAKAAAQAAGDGNAQASAEVSAGGEATGEFQLGHAFHNSTDRQMDLAVAIRFHYDLGLQVPADQGLVEASVGLKLYARGQRNVLLRADDLVQHNAENGPTARAGDDRQQFTLTLGPGDEVSVFVAGQARVNAKEGRSAACSLKLSGLEMEVESRPAPPVRTASDEQQ